MKHIVLTTYQWEMLRNLVKERDGKDFSLQIDNDWKLLVNEIDGAKDLPTKQFLVHTRIRSLQSGTFLGTHKALIRADTKEEAETFALRAWDERPDNRSTRLILSHTQEIPTTAIYTSMNQP